MDLTGLLYKNGYSPEWDEEVFEKVMEQAEDFKKYQDKALRYMIKHLCVSKDTAIGPARRLRFPPWPETIVTTAF